MAKHLSEQQSQSKKIAFHLLYHISRPEIVQQDVCPSLRTSRKCYMSYMHVTCNQQCVILLQRCWRCKGEHEELKKQAEELCSACVSIDRLEFDCLHAVLCSVEVETERVELLKAKVFNKLKNHQSVLQNTVEINFLIWVF